jgi:MFS family permease
MSMTSYGKSPGRVAPDTLGSRRDDAGDTNEANAALYRKLTRRILPFLFLAFVVAYIDRVNVSFAKLQMLADLHLSETVYGIGAGIFFLGYFIFEVPSNLILDRVGARRWIARIMVTWAIVSCATMFAHDATSFYVLRFLLGVAEAGFFPGIVLYLSNWFPSARRSQIIALFMTAIPVSGAIGGPLSGWVMSHFAGTYGLAGGKWLCAEMRQRASTIPCAARSRAAACGCLASRTSVSRWAITASRSGCRRSSRRVASRVSRTSAGCRRCLRSSAPLRWC